MTEPTVRCGCGRTMTPDARRGRGAYRCGCGALIHITIPAPPTRCAGSYNEEPCRTKISVTEPLPLCKEHYAESGLKEYHSWINGTPDEIRERIEVRSREVWRELVADTGKPGPPPPTEEELEERGVVYFIRSQDLVKIGTTQNLRSRMTSFSVPHITLLATEPGYLKRERELHRQFRPLRTKSVSEWYRLEPPLTSYIDDIREKYGLPAVVV